MIKEKIKCENDCGEEAGNWIYKDKSFCSSSCMHDYLEKNNIIQKPKQIIPGKSTKAKFIKKTFSAYSSETKDRWECPACRENKAPECRFNLSPKKRGSTHKCRFCKTELLLDPL